MDGILFHSDDPAFDRLIADRTYNQKVLTTARYASPSLLAMPKTTADVVRIVRYAHEHNHTISVRTGGHNWFGISLKNSSNLLVDMRQFDSIEINGETATVGPAALGQVLNEQANQQNLWFPSGHCVGVPLGGYILGGGFGWFQHAAGGMAAELLQSMTIVTFDGSILEITDETHPDWMWLARGAASAFPAIMVSMTLRLQPLAPLIRHQTNVVALEHYESIVQLYCQLQMEGQLSPRLELSVVPACLPPFLREVLDDPVPDKVCLCNVYVMADNEDEFAASVLPIQVDLSKFNLFRTEFRDRTLSELTNAMGNVYPPGLAWDVRSYQVETKSYESIDWRALRTAFEEQAPRTGLTHILTVIGPDQTFAHGGAYGKKLPGLVVAGYCAMDVTAPDEVREQCNTMLYCMEQTLGESATKYNPLEHPVHSKTFSKCFPECDRMLQLRNRYDPEKRFMDPCQLQP